MEVIYKILNGLYPSYLNDIIMLMTKNDCVKLGSWCQGLVQYVMDRTVYDLYVSLVLWNTYTVQCITSVRVKL